MHNESRMLSGTTDKAKPACYAGTINNAKKAGITRRTTNKIKQTEKKWK